MAESCVSVEQTKEEREELLAGSHDIRSRNLHPRLCREATCCRHAADGVSSTIRETETLVRKRSCFQDGAGRIPLGAADAVREIVDFIHALRRIKGEAHAGKSLPQKAVIERPAYFSAFEKPLTTYEVC
ncbi:MAG: hypothetical protein ACLR7U_13890 [Ruthenibacterium lactatiformans]